MYFYRTVSACLLHVKAFDFGYCIVIYMKVFTLVSGMGQLKDREMVSWDGIAIEESDWWDFQREHRVL